MSHSTWQLNQTQYDETKEDIKNEYDCGDKVISRHQGNLSDQHNGGNQLGEAGSV